MERKARHVPQRTCIVCRAKKAKRDLHRMVVISGNIEWDKFNRLPGRGAYVCKHPDCIRGLEAMWNLQRFFRKSSAKLVKDTVEQMQKNLNQVHTTKPQE